MGNSASADRRRHSSGRSAAGGQEPEESAMAKLVKCVVISILLKKVALLSEGAKSRSFFLWLLVYVYITPTTLGLLWFTCVYIYYTYYICIYTHVYVYIELVNYYGNYKPNIGGHHLVGLWIGSDESWPPGKSWTTPRCKNPFSVTLNSNCRSTWISTVMARNTSYKYWTNPIYRLYNPIEITSYNFHKWP